MLINVSTRRFGRAVRLPEGDISAPAGAGVAGLGRNGPPVLSLAVRSISDATSGLGRHVRRATACLAGERPLSVSRIYASCNLFGSTAATTSIRRNGRLDAPCSRKRPFRLREEFRAPLGVRKSPRNEPACQQAMIYGYFCFRPSLAQSRPALVAAGGDAICRNCRGL